ncbi:MAG: VWA domain-containing protein, partial [bacterium]
MAGWVRGSTIGVLLVIASVALWGQVVAAQERRVVAVGVVDERGEPVAGLAAENFRGKYRGKAVKVISAEREAGPRRIVVLLDMSESMDGAPGKWSYARTAFEGLVAYGPEGAKLALVTFDGAPEKRIGFEEWNAEAGLALGELEKPRKVRKGERPRELWEAWRIAEEEMLAERRLGDVVYFISDGPQVVYGDAVPAGSANSRPPVCDGIRYFTFDFPERGRGRPLLSELAEGTGGGSLHAVFGGAIRDRVSKAYVPLEGV